MSREYNLVHLRINSTGEQKYTSPKTPPHKKLAQRDRYQHANKLKHELNDLKQQLIQQNRETSLITVEGKEGFNLESKSLADKRSRIDVLKVYKEQGIEKAIIRVSNNKGFEKLLNKVEVYETQNTTSGKAKNKSLVESIEKIRGALIKELWGGKMDLWPDDNYLECWWEIWIDGGSLNLETNNLNKSKCVIECNKLGIIVEAENFIIFPNRQATIIKASINKLELLMDELETITEIDPPSKAMINYGSNERIIPSRDFNLNYIQSSESNIRVTVIDTGIAANNPFLRSVIAGNGLHNVQGDDKPLGDSVGHGTKVAGIAALGELSGLINRNVILVPYKIESVRIPIDSTGERMAMWGKTIIDSVDIVEKCDNDTKRIFNLSIGAEGRDNGEQTAWSATIDELCYNESKGRLFTIAAGNIESTIEGYKNSNLINVIDDPGQALNAICVGGYTELDETLDSIGNTVAKKGELSPFTRSGVAKGAIKPDVVYEAGNTIWNGNEIENWGAGISILTTSKDVISNPITLSSQTSMAAPGIARLLALIWNENSEYLPTTIRGLLAHSAYPTIELAEQFSRDGKIALRRACGYGVPNIHLACRSAKSNVCIIDEGEYEYFYRTDEGNIIKKLMVYDLPWPKEKLLELGEEKIFLKVTLSFFIEPNPKVATSNYEGASLAWEMQGDLEEEEQFMKRVNKNNRTDTDPTSGYTNEIKWTIGSMARNRGTLQSDYVEMTAAELASCGKIVIYPRKGWWDNLKDKKSKKIPYSIIISVQTNDEDIDIYTSIMNEIQLTSRVENNVSISVN